MVDCSSAGVHPWRFAEMTLGEVFTVLEGERKRQRNELVGRIVACARALGQAFGGRRALDGIEGVDDSDACPVGIAEVRRLRFWRRADDA